MDIVRVTTSPPAWPLPVYSSEVLATATSKDGDCFTIALGLTQELARQLQTYSLDTTDTDLQKTSDYERFGTGSYEAWYEKDRTPFALVHEATGALSALIWLGPKPLGRGSLKHLTEEEKKQDERLLDAGDWHTISYRSYQPFRGKGLMKDFMRFAIGEYERMHPGCKIWAGIFGDNEASVGLVAKLGFTLYSTSDTGETILVKE